MVTKSFEQFLDQQEKVKVWPSRRSRQELILRYLSAHFEFERAYTEKDVNTILLTGHSFGDPAILRRELISLGYLNRRTDGSRYWKTNQNRIPFSWETGRLLVDLATANDVEDLENVYESCRYYESWTDDQGDRCLTMLDFVYNANLPPGGNKELATLHSIRLKATGEIVGYLNCYHGYPEKNIF
ncbi:MAG: DUF2087 domain-containing protein [Planctomycetes bacterium]|nr:DUF2087 domain-containing protein [Planctomycetota bacterium]